MARIRRLSTGSGSHRPDSRVMNPAGLDVVVRLYDLSDLPRLDHCLFALFGQSLAALSPDADPLGPLRLHLMLRRFSFAEVQALRTATQALRALDQTAQLTMHNWEIPEPFDLRVPLLNWGLEVAKGRYFTCLDVGDLVLPGAYARLLSRLRLTRAAMALGGVIKQPVRWWGDVVMPLTSAPVCLNSPLGGSDDADSPPVFLLDRARVPLQELKFRVGLPDKEIADFVQRIRESHAVDLELHGDLLAIRQIPD
jgi:hypothetical protein